MAKREFNRELERYLSSRKKGTSIWRKLFAAEKKLAKKPKTHPEVKTYEEEKPSKRKERKGDKEPFWKRWFTPHDGGEQPFDEMPAGPTIEDDLNDVAHIALHLLKQLPPEELAKFKDSDEFRRFKEILKQHELIH